MNFIRTKEGEWINLDHVELIRREEKEIPSPSDINEYIFKIGASNHKGTVDSETLEQRLTGKIIPSHTGTYLIYYGLREENFWFIKMPVIAWCAGNDGALPITLEYGLIINTEPVIVINDRYGPIKDEDDDLKSLDILFPCGMVVVVGTITEIYVSIDDWKQQKEKTLRREFIDAREQG